MIERIICYGVLAVVILTVAASILPKVTPSVIALGLLVLLGRVVWWYLGDK